MCGDCDSGCGPSVERRVDVRGRADDVPSNVLPPPLKVSSATPYRDGQKG